MMFSALLQISGLSKISRISPTLKDFSTKTHFMITSTMRATLHEDLLYSKEDVREMSPNFAAAIIKHGKKKWADVTDEDVTYWKDYFDKNDSLPVCAQDNLDIYHSDDHRDIPHEAPGKEQ